MITKKQIKQLSNSLDGKLHSDLVTKILYSTDASMFKVNPKIVIEPKSIDDLRKIISFATKFKLPITARGAGTGLAGESLGEGIILDFSVHFNSIRKIDPSTGDVIIGPGVVLGQLNRELKKIGRLFGPDPATQNRCTLGGMIANNSTGAHSLRYGMTRDHINSLKIILFNGEIVDMSSTKVNEISHPIFLKIKSLLGNSKQLIEETWPKTPRNRHGYLLKDVLTEDQIDLSKLICGSEGTLGIIVEANLRTSPLPKHNKLICLCFKDRNSAADTTHKLLKFDPAAIELIDDVCLEMVRTDEKYSSIFSKDINSLLLVELDGDDLAQIDNKIDMIQKDFTGNEKAAEEIIICNSEEHKEKIWKIRSLISGMINKLPNDYQPIPLIEDVCVDPKLLKDYFERMEVIFSKYNLKFLAFGHAGDGTVHIRPFLNTQTLKDFHELPTLCEEVYDLTLDLGGTISGEHGDGYLRSPFLKKQYGDLYPVFEVIKKTFDPINIFNPDKLTGQKDFSRWKNNLRYNRYNPFPTLLNFKKKKLEDIAKSCNGCGVCRSALNDNDMCPIFRRYGTEISSTRAKANIMRALLQGELSLSQIKELKKVADYCVNCKMCSYDCPSGVNAADMMLEIKAIASKRLGKSIEIQALLLFETLLNLGSLLPRLTNFISNLLPVKWILDRLFKIDKRRSSPQLALKSFKAQFKFKKNYAPLDKVVYFIDTFSNIVNTQIADATIKVLEKNNIEVIIPDQKGSGIVDLNYGNLSRAKKVAKYNIEKLIPYVKSGHKIICSEPSAALMLKEEYQLLNDSENEQLISDNTLDIISYLALLNEKNLLDTNFISLPKSIGHHIPCHLKAIDPNNSIFKIFGMIPDLKTHFINKGCCGIAGTFGMRKKGHNDSLIIAEQLFDTINTSNFDLVTTDCTTCKMQIEHGTHAKTVHPIEIVAMAYGLKHFP